MILKLCLKKMSNWRFQHFALYRTISKREWILFKCGLFGACQIAFGYQYLFLSYERQPYIPGSNNIASTLPIRSADSFLQATTSRVVFLYRQTALNLQKRISIHPSFISLLPSSTFQNGPKSSPNYFNDMSFLFLGFHLNAHFAQRSIYRLLHKYAPSTML